MLAWMVGAMVPALALCLAALLAEQAARQRHTPSRWSWLAAMVASLLLPLLGPVLPLFAPGHLAMPALRAAQALVPAARADALARGLWLMLSAATLAVLAGAALLLGRRARDWRRVRLDGTLVRIAPSAGPAVFGWWRPEIVLPEWLANAPPRQRELAIAHERSHLDAGDPRLLAVAFGLLAIMPWNLPLWWQLHRLRRAIEIDCDRRVLRGGGDLVDYGETLIELSQHQSRQVGLMAATSPPLSFLERRISIMSSPSHRWSRPAAVALAGLALGVAAVAAQLTPPSSAGPPLAVVHQTAAEAARSDAIQMDEGQLDEAKEAAESAAEEAAEAKHEAEAAEAEAHEAMRDAEQQLKQATAAKHAAEAAEAEARARKREAEATVRP